MAAKPRILIASACFGDVAPEVLGDWMRFAFNCGRHLPQYDFFIGIRTKAEQFRARNSLVEGAQQVNADWILMIDDDMIIDTNVHIGPSDSYNFIEKLILRDKDIIGALYHQRVGGCMPVAMYESGERGYRFLRPDEVTRDLQQVDVVGGGVMLVRMNVFDHLPHPYFAPEHEYGTDVQLCRAAKKAGYKIWLDSSIELGHLKTERAIITSHNRMQHSLADVLPGEVKSQTINSDIFSLLLEDAKKYTGFRTAEEIAHHGQMFMKAATLEKFADKAQPETLAAWYREFPMERVARQVWYNTANSHKKQMTEFILSAINDAMKVDILDFGCGIGIPAFEFARRGHRVTAADIDGTGTVEFLKWRCSKHDVKISHHALRGMPHFGDQKFAVIVAMDVLEHIPDWRWALETLISYLQPGGVLFANNAILDDDQHPEHFPLNGKEFVKECIDLDLQPVNEIMYMKKMVTKAA